MKKFLVLIFTIITLIIPVSFCNASGPTFEYSIGANSVTVTIKNTSNINFSYQVKLSSPDDQFDRAETRVGNGDVVFQNLKSGIRYNIDLYDYSVPSNPAKLLGSNFMTLVQGNLSVDSESDITARSAKFRVNISKENIAYIVSLYSPNSTTPLSQQDGFSGSNSYVTFTGLTPKTSYVAKISLKDPIYTNPSLFPNNFATTDQEAPLKITSSTPSGKYNDFITITGENFYGISKVLFGLVEADTKDMSVSEKEIKVKVPGGLYEKDCVLIVRVLRNGQIEDWYSPNRFKIEFAPVTFTPSKGEIGDIITITGENLTKLKSVLFNGTKTVATITNNEREIKVRVPDGASSGLIIVTTDFTQLESTSIFTVIKKEISLSASSGQIGKEVKIIGKDILPLAESEKMKVVDVLFNGVSATTTDIPVNAGGQIEVVAVIPEGATTGPVTLIVEGVNEGDSNVEVTSTTNFTVLASSGTNTPPATTKSLLKRVKAGEIIPKCNTELDNKGGYSNPCGFAMVITLINNLINFITLTIATPLFAIIIIYVGWLYLSSGGSSENVSKAKTILKNVVIGYVIILAAWLIVNTILSALGFTGDSFLG